MGSRTLVSDDLGIPEYVRFQQKKHFVGGPLATPFRKASQVCKHDRRAIKQFRDRVTLTDVISVHSCVGQPPFLLCSFFLQFIFVELVSDVGREQGRHNGTRCDGSGGELLLLTSDEGIIGKEDQRDKKEDPNDDHGIDNWVGSGER